MLCWVEMKRLTKPYIPCQKALRCLHGVLTIIIHLYFVMEDIVKLVGVIWIRILCGNPLKGNNHRETKKKTAKCRPISFIALFFHPRIHPATSVSGHIINKHQ